MVAARYEAIDALGIESAYTLLQRTRCDTGHLQKTRTTGVRGRRIGVQVLDEAAAAHEKMVMRLPVDKKVGYI